MGGGGVSVENLLNAGDLKAEALLWRVGLATLGILLAAILRDMVVSGVVWFD